MEPKDIKAIFIGDSFAITELLFKKGCIHIEMPIEVLEKRMREKQILIVHESYKNLNKITQLTDVLVGTPIYCLGLINPAKLGPLRNFVATKEAEWHLFNYYFKNFNKQNLNDYISKQG